MILGAKVFPCKQLRLQKTEKKRVGYRAIFGRVPRSDYQFDRLYQALLSYDTGLIGELQKTVPFLLDSVVFFGSTIRAIR